MKEPDIPGRIIAQIARAPEAKNAHMAGSAIWLTVSDVEPPRRPRLTNTTTPTPRANQMCRVSGRLIIAHATTMEPATSPRNSAAINTVRVLSRWLSIGASETTASRRPVPSGTMNTHSTLPIQRLKLSRSALRMFPSAEEPALMDAISRS